MPSVRGCNLPDELLYDVNNHIWFTEMGDGTVKIGMTAVATAMAGKLVAYTPKKVGRSVDANKSAATVESGKWVGPVKSPVAGEVVAVNDAVTASPKSINADPYGNGWLVKMKPANWDADAGSLVTGAAAMQAFEAKMAADGFAGCP